MDALDQSSGETSIRSGGSGRTEEDRTECSEESEDEPCPIQLLHNRWDEGVDDTIVRIRKKYREVEEPEPGEVGYELLQQNPLIDVYYWEGSPPLRAIEEMCKDGKIGVDHLEECYDIASTVEAACVRRYLRRADFERWVFLTLCSETTDQFLADPEIEEWADMLELEHISQGHGLLYYYDEDQQEVVKNEGMARIRPLYDLEDEIRRVYCGTKHEE